MCLFKMCKSAIRVVTNAGAVFVGSILERVGFRDKCESLTVAVAHPENQISCSDIMTTAIGIMCSGNVTYESAREYNNDKDFYQEALGIDRIPSPERLRQRLDQAAFEGGDNLRKQLRDINVSVLKHENVTISALPSGFVPVDCDVTPCNESKSHKEGVSRTYKGFDGYSPMDAHIGVEGYFINTDFREGKQHSQKGTPAFLIESVDSQSAAFSPGFWQRFCGKYRSYHGKRPLLHHKTQFKEGVKIRLVGVSKNVCANS